MERKIIFFDIDGTIMVEKTTEIPQSTIDAIREARKNGHLTFINTGRTYINIDRKIREIGFDGYVCGCGTFIKAGEQVLLSTSIDKKTCRAMIDKLRECKIGAVLEGLEDVYFDSVDFEDKELRRIKKSFIKKGLGVEKNWDSEDIQYDKIFAVADENSNLQAFRAAFESEFDFIDRGNNWWEIVPGGYSKATGIEYLLKHYNIPIENSYAIGDSSNDLSMLEFVQNGIAMKNSDECVYDIASFITRDITDDGIWHALKHYRIISAKAM